MTKTRTLGLNIGRAPGRYLCLPLILVLLLGAGLTRLSFNVDYRVFFDADNPQLAAFNHLQDNFSASEKLLLVYTPSSADVFTATSLRTLQAATAELWKTPYSTRVDSLTNFQRTIAAGDDLFVDNLVPDDSTFDPAQLADVKHFALHEPMLVNRLIAPGGHVTGLLVTINKPGHSPKEAAAIVAHGHEVEDLIKRLDPGARVDLTGMIMMSNTFSESARADMSTLLPLMLLLVVVGLRYFLQSWKATFGIVLVILLSAVGGMGAGGWMGIQLSSPSAISPMIILTIAVAHSVHMANSFLRLQWQQVSPDNVNQAIRDNIKPMLIAGITTLVGFITMNFSDVPPYHDLGNIVAVGVTLATLLSLTFLPAFLHLSNAKPRKELLVNRWIIPSLLRLVTQHSVTTLLVVGGGAVALSLFIGNSTLNDQFVDYFDERTPFRIATDYTDEHLTGIYSVEYAVSRKGSTSAVDPLLLAELDEFEAWLLQQPEVRHVASISDTFKLINQNMNGGDRAHYRLPASPELSAQYLLMYEMSLPFGLDVSDRLSMDRRATRVVITLHNISSQDMLTLETRINQHIKTVFPQWETLSSSPMLMFSHIGQKNIKSMIIGVLTALLLISVALAVVLGSFRLGLLSLLPNLVPIVSVFGLWGLLVGELGLSMALVGGMCLGVVVDDTVHFLNRYQLERRRGADGKVALEQVLYHSGAPIIITSVLLAAGFLLLGGSSFKLNSDMGNATGLIILMALLFDLLALPAWLAWSSRTSTQTATKAITD
ncbi:MAG: MMPL family transporter [Pseudomonadota bacterium]|nr:MMPL family transporter [Pseudomonadota bacterium]